MAQCACATSVANAHTEALLRAYSRHIVRICAAPALAFYHTHDDSIAGMCARRRTRAHAAYYMREGGTIRSVYIIGMAWTQASTQQPSHARRDHSHTCSLAHMLTRTRAARTHTHTHTCTHTHTYARRDYSCACSLAVAVLRTHAHTHTYTHAHTRTPRPLARMLTRTRTHGHTRTHARVRAHASTHTHTPAPARPHTRAHTHRCARAAITASSKRSPLLR